MIKAQNALCMYYDNMVINAKHTHFIESQGHAHVAAEFIWDCHDFWQQHMYTISLYSQLQLVHEWACKYFIISIVLETFHTFEDKTIVN